jgi:hypothetical protein
MIMSLRVPKKTEFRGQLRGSKFFKIDCSVELGLLHMANSTEQSILKLGLLHMAMI